MKKKLCLLLFSFFLTVISAQNNKEIWTKIAQNKAVQGQRVLRKTEPLKALFYQLNLSELKNTLSAISNKAPHKQTTRWVVPFPNSEGGFDNFKVEESSTLEPAYQEKHPEIRTYIGKNIKNPSSIISFSITPQGFHGMILASKTGTQFIDPYSESNTYVVYNRGDLPELNKQFECLVSDGLIVEKESLKNTKLRKNPNDSKLRTFRLALASTIEYSEFHWRAAGLNELNTIEEKKAAVRAAMVVTMNRVNTIFQRDLAIKMILVDNTNLIFIDSDNFSNTNANLLIEESQTEIDAAAMAAPFTYDIGHTFSTGGGGVASLNSPCTPSRKAKGITGLRNPVGDAYDIDFVAHEMGHQFGALHTFNGNTGNCSGNNRTPSNAYEPASGTTIMGYAGICPPQNIQRQSDAYFHQKSIQLIWDNITRGASTCGAETIVANKTPVANAGPDYIIPVSTPFKLVGNSTDPDGTLGHTYTWEQYDLGPSGLPQENNVLGPLVRSFEGTTNPIRNIPKFSDYISEGGSTTWEKIPSVNRSLTFALTVRDNDVNGANGAGQTDVDFVNITVNSTDPFTVVNPVSWTQGTSQNIEWEVGQSANVSGINCQTVRIKLSTDAGLTFPTVITSSTPNNGSFSYIVPDMADTENARILIEAVDNIFYDVSNFNFSISKNPDFFIAEEVLTPINCGDTSVEYTFNFIAANGYNENTVFSLSNLPENSVATFTPASLNASGNVTLSISNLNDVPQDNYNIRIIGTSSVSSKTKGKSINLPFFNSLCNSAGNTSFLTSTTFVEFNTISNTTGKTSYSDFKEISTDVNRNIPYDLTVRVNTAGAFPTNTMVWIDWNQNCSFNDPGETYNLGDAFNVSDGETMLSPISITIPTNAALGNTTMRVSTKYREDGLPIPCENNFDGEVEDYTLNILPEDLIFESSITSVAFNTINQVSEKPSKYSDFTSVSTDVNRDDFYDLIVKVSTERDFETATKVWIDWNQDSNFNDDEAYNLGVATNVTNQNTSNTPLSIQIPVNAILGPTTMRVATIYSGDLGLEEPIATQSDEHGEVEDYTINVLPKQSVEQEGFENLIVFPNPSNGDFNIKLNGSISRDITVDIFNITGKSIANIVYKATGDFNQRIHFNSLVQAGVYILKISDGLKTVNQKIIIF